MNKMDWFVIIASLSLTAIMGITMVSVLLGVRKKFPKDRAWSLVLILFGGIYAMLLYLDIKLIIDVVTH